MNVFFFIFCFVFQIISCMVCRVKSIRSVSGLSNIFIRSFFAIFSCAVILWEFEVDCRNNCPEKSQSPRKNIDHMNKSDARDCNVNDCDGKVCENYSDIDDDDYKEGDHKIIRVSNSKVSDSNKFFVKELVVKGIDVDKFSRIEIVSIKTDFAYILTFSKALGSSYLAKYYKISLKTGRAHLLWSRSLKCNGFPPMLCKKLSCDGVGDTHGSVEKSKEFSENSVLRISSGNRLYILDKASGNVLFFMNFSSHIENLYFDCQNNHLYVKTCNNRVYCYVEICEINDDLMKNGLYSGIVRNKKVEKSRSKNSSRIKYLLSENWFNVEYLNYLSQSSRSMILKNGIAIVAYGHILCGFDSGEDVFIYNLNEIASVMNKDIDMSTHDCIGSLISDVHDADRDASVLDTNSPSIVCKKENRGKVCYFSFNYAKNANYFNNAKYADYEKNAKLNTKKSQSRNVHSKNSNFNSKSVDVNVIFPRSMSMDLFADETRFFAIDQSGYVFCFDYNRGLLWSRKCNFFIKSWAASGDYIALSSSDACFLISKSRGAELKKYRLKKLIRVVHADISTLNDDVQLNDGYEDCMKDYGQYCTKVAAKVSSKIESKVGLSIGFKESVKRADDNSNSYFLAFCVNGLYLISSKSKCKLQCNIISSNEIGSSAYSRSRKAKSTCTISNDVVSNESSNTSSSRCQILNSSKHASKKYEMQKKSSYSIGVLLKSWNSEMKRFAGYSNGFSFAVIGNKLVILRVYKNC